VYAINYEKQNITNHDIIIIFVKVLNRDFINKHRDMSEEGVSAKPLYKSPM